MHTTSQPPTLLIGTAPEVPWARLAALLAMIRAQYPHFRIRLHQAQPRCLFDELAAGQCDLVLAPPPAPHPILESMPVWRDELAVALPLRSPLLAYSTIPTESIQDYPLIQWNPAEHEALHRHVETLVGGSVAATYTVASFEMMVALVAAGFGIGIAQRSRLDHVRAWPVGIRPLAAQGRWIGTELFWIRGQPPQIREFLLAATATME